MRLHGGSWWHRVAFTLRRIRKALRERSRQSDDEARRDIDEELAFHVEQRVRDYRTRGLDAESARRAAHERLGDLERVRIECGDLLAAERRADERRSLLNISWLDVKLGIRMLAKYPGLSLVAGLGLAIVIAIGAGYVGALDAILDPHLPLADGDRIVSIRNVDRRSPPSGYQFRANVDGQSTYEFQRWRDELETVRELSAFRAEARNLILPDGRTGLVQVAAMTASGFAVARVSPLMGRSLVEADERPGAPNVVVIAYEEWQRRFDGDPGVLGRTVRLGESDYTVVGVMPEGYRFPLYHRYWIPLRLDPSANRPDQGSSINVFGRLADGVTLARAQSELTTIGATTSTAFPDVRARVEPRLLPYAYPFMGRASMGTPPEFRLLRLVLGLLVAVIAVNVAILVYARTATRIGEIAVRSALGASRRRVITQLFIEALVLCLAAATVGVVLAGVALGKVQQFWQRGSGDAFFFWLKFRLTPVPILFVVVLVAIASAIIGVIPGLKATGRRVQSGLQQLSMRGSRMQLGPTWTALIIVQVAVAVAGLPLAMNRSADSAEVGTRSPASAASELLRATLVMAPESLPGPDTARANAAIRSRFAARTTELVRRLGAEPDVADITYARYFPGLEPGAAVEIEPVEPSKPDTSAPARQRMAVRANRVGIGLFDALDVSPRAGRILREADAGAAATGVVVSATFAQRVAGGASVLGRRLRLAPREGEPGPWLEVVGVVPDFVEGFTIPSSFDGPMPRVYQAMELDGDEPLTLVVRVRGRAAADFASRLRDITAAVDPALQLERVETVTGAWNLNRQAFFYLALGILALTGSVLLLSAAGVYALMSFTVTRRRREIGIRSALGAEPRRVLTGIFARASLQLAAGVAAGLAADIMLDRILPGALLDGKGPVLIPSICALIAVIGLLAALGPARRGLAVQPTEALRAE